MRLILHTKSPFLLFWYVKHPDFTIKRIKVYIPKIQIEDFGM